jgi:CBS domain-containing protein
MTENPVTISANASIGKALQQVENDDFSTYPVVDGNEAFIGFVTEARLRRTAAENGSNQKVASITQPSPHAQPDDTLVRAVVKMEKSGARQLAVLDRGNRNKLIGLLTMSDIVRAQARAAIEADDSDKSESREPGKATNTLKA